MQANNSRLTIVVALDGSQFAERSVTHAWAMANVFDAKITLMQVVPGISSQGQDTVDCMDWQLRCRQANQYLDEIAAPLLAAGLECDVVVEGGDPAARILSYCEANDVDLIVLTRVGKSGLREWGDGSVARKVVAGANTSILLISPDTDRGADPSTAYHRIVVPVDDSQGAEWSASLAARIARGSSGVVDLLYVMTTPLLAPEVAARPESKDLLSRLEQLASREATSRLDRIVAGAPKDIRFEKHLKTTSDAARAIARFAERQGADLILTYSHGMADSDSWRYGSVSEALLNRCQSAILVFQRRREATAGRFCQLPDRDAKPEAVDNEDAVAI